MRPIEKLLALGATLLDAVHTARLLTDEADLLHEELLEQSPDDPAWARALLKTLATTRALQQKVNQRFDGFSREAIQYYRAYLIARDDAFQGSVYEDGVHIIKRWTNNPKWEPTGYPPNVRGLVQILEGLSLPLIDEVQILGEIHIALDAANSSTRVST